DVIGNPTPAHVLATPTILGLIEVTAAHALLPHIPSQCLYVGMHVDLSHLRPTPVGMDVTVTVDLAQIRGNKFDWIVTLHDAIEKVAEAQLTTALVPAEEFMAHAASKQAQR
ncbi:MAG: hypothetical protein OWS74_01565, partial [Firmicutes bacterium]|nr:hypothetical protein [Bacillota bacterium]